VEFQQNAEDETIEFHKDEEKSAVVNQNGLVCVIIIIITAINALYFYHLFSFPVHWAMARVQYAAGKNCHAKEVPCYQCCYSRVP
jgi:hypothetical protein